MSKETVRKVIYTTPPRTGEADNLPAFVKVATYHPDHGEETKLILQRYLLTKIETIINRDEALAITTALMEHFDFSPEEIVRYFTEVNSAVHQHNTPATAIIVVSGPRGCGKTKRADQISKHFGDAAIVEGDEFGAIVTIKSLAGKVKNMVVLTNADHDALYHLRRRLTEAGFANQHRTFKGVMTEIQQTCKHDWQKRCCADIHQSDYLQCSLCDLTKEM